MKYLIFLFIGACLLMGASMQSRAQESPVDQMLELGYSEGMPFYIKYYVTNEFYHSLRVNYSWRTTDATPWAKYYQYPSQGVGLQYIQMGNRQTLGDTYGAYYFFEYYLYEGRRLSLPVRLGGGIGLHTKTYEQYTNYKNHSVGSLINAMFVTKLAVRYRVGKHLSAEPFFSFTHFSNAGMKLPNRGINFLSLGLSAQYHLLPVSRDIPERRPPKWAPQPLQHEVIAMAGLRSVDQVANNRYPAAVLTYRLIQPLTAVLHLGTGLDASWDFSYPPRMERIGEPDARTIDGLKTGAHFSAGLDFGRVRPSVYVGYYFYKKDPIAKPIFIRLNMAYAAHDHWFGLFSFQSQQHKADHISLGLGYRF